MGLWIALSFILTNSNIRVHIIHRLFFVSLEKCLNSHLTVAQLVSDTVLPLIIFEVDEDVQNVAGKSSGSHFGDLVNILFFY